VGFFEWISAPFSKSVPVPLTLIVRSTAGSTAKAAMPAAADAIAAKNNFVVFILIESCITFIVRIP
jgi:hypothetical protein